MFWRNSDLLKILIGETVSDVGSQIGDLALPLVAAVTLEASAGQMASLLAAEFVPRIVVGVIAAGWIDRVRRRPVLVAANLARFVILMGVVAAAWRNALTVELLYGVAFLLAGLDVVFTSTFAAYLPLLVPTAMLSAANGARATSRAAADVVGPALAGGLISVVGASAAVLIDGASFLASVIGVALVRANEPATTKHASHKQPIREIAGGWRALLSNPVLRASTATAFTANFFYRVVMAVYILYLTRRLGLDPAVVGLIFGLGGGLGVLIGSAAAAPLARRFGIGPTMIGAHLLFGPFGLPLALSALPPASGTPLVFASEFLQLAVNAVYMVNRTTLEQALSAPEMRGRIQTSRSVVHAVAGVLGLLLGGIIGERASPGAAIVVGVIGGLTSFVWLLASPLGGLKQLSNAERIGRRLSAP